MSDLGKDVVDDSPAREAGGAGDLADAESMLVLDDCSPLSIPGRAVADRTPFRN